KIVNGQETVASRLLAWRAADERFLVGADAAVAEGVDQQAVFTGDGRHFEADRGVAVGIGGQIGVEKERGGRRVRVRVFVSVLFLRLSGLVGVGHGRSAHRGRS